MRKETLRVLLVALCLMIPLTAMAERTAQEIEEMASDILITTGAPDTTDTAEQPAETAMPAPTVATVAVAATTEEPSESPFRFSLLPALPENQDADITTYFSMIVTPGQAQTLQVDVTNLGYEPIAITMDVARAMTNENGLIQYAATDNPADESLQADIATFVSFEVARLELAAQETRTVSILVDPPAEPFGGTLLGGLVFLREQNESEQSDSTGMALGSLYSYVLPIRLHSTGAPVGTIEPSFELVSVQADIQTVFGYRTLVSIRNPQPLVVKPLTLTCVLYAAGDAQTPVAASVNDSVEMAPNTVMNYSILQDDALAPGTYTAHITIEYQGKTSTFEEIFTIADA